MSFDFNQDMGLALGESGEPVTLSHAAYTRPITAVVTDICEPGSPIDGIAAHEEHFITCDPADAAGVTTEWTTTITGQSVTRPVLACVPDNGMVVIHLGDKL